MATTDQQTPAKILAQAGLTVEQLYDELTDNCTRPVRLEDIVYEAAERVPGLVPTRAEIDVERTRKLADKERLELAQGLLLAEILAIPRTGLHLVESMLYPTELALEHLDELRANGTVDLGHARVTRRGLRRVRAPLSRKEFALHPPERLAPSGSGAPGLAGPPRGGRAGVLELC